jgi:hypothetical protein
MPSPRKKWSVTVDAVGTWNREQCASQRAAYDKVDRHRANYKAGWLRGSRVTVWVDEGHGWQPFERIDFAEEA